MSNALKVIPAAVAVLLAVVIGLNTGSRPDDIEKRMESCEYKAEQAAHFEKIGAAR